MPRGHPVEPGKRNMSPGMFRGLTLVGEARRSLGTRRWSDAVRDMLADSTLVKRVHHDPELHLRIITNYQAGEPGYDRVLLKVHRGLIGKAAGMGPYAKMTPYDFGDRWQVAALGLLEAAGRVDEERLRHPQGLTSYLWLYVKQRVTRYVYDEGQVVRIPVHWYDKGREGRKPLKRHVFTFSEMGAEHRGEEDEQRFEDTLEDDAPPVDDHVSEEELHEVILPRLMWFLVSLLDARHAEVIIDRFAYDQYYRGTVSDWREGRSKKGAPASQGPTLIDIGKRMGVSRERVRQLEVEALTMMREKACRLRLGLPDGVQVPSRHDMTFEEWCAAVYASALTEVERRASLPTSGWTMIMPVSWDAIRSRRLLEKAMEEKKTGASRPRDPAAPPVRVAQEASQLASPQGTRGVGDAQSPSAEYKLGERVALLTAKVADLEGRLEVSRKQRAELERALSVRSGQLDLAAAARAFQGLVRQGLMTADEALARLADADVKKGR